MPTINQNATSSISLNAGQWIDVKGTGVAVPQIGPTKGQPQTITNFGKVGPFDFAQTVSLTATGNALTYNIIEEWPDARVDVDATGNPTGQIVTPSGDVVGDTQGDGLNANTEDTSSVNIARQIKASAGRVTSILCTTGSAITLTLYDNAAASATGRQIYSGALSAGDVVQPADAWFAQGCYASFTGTAAFVINTSESAQ